MPTCDYYAKAGRAFIDMQGGYGAEREARVRLQDIASASWLHAEFSSDILFHSLSISRTSQLSDILLAFIITARLRHAARTIELRLGDF